MGLVKSTFLFLGVSENWVHLKKIFWREIKLLGTLLSDKPKWLIGIPPNNGCYILRMDRLCGFWNHFKTRKLSCSSISDRTHGSQPCILQPNSWLSQIGIQSLSKDFGCRMQVIKYHFNTFNLLTSLSIIKQNKFEDQKSEDHPPADHQHQPLEAAIC